MRYLPITKIFVHHSAINGDVPQFNAVKEAHERRGWGDKTAYNFFLEKSGVVEDGRPDGDSSAATRSWVANQSGIHVCLAGNFENEEPTEHQLNALRKLVLHKMELYKIKPENVLGHRDVQNTLCPGKNLYSELKSLRFTHPEWSNKGVEWAKQEKIITKITGEPVEDFRLAKILRDFKKKFIK